MRKLTVLAIAMLASIVSSTCSASILSSYLTFNGVRDELIDQSKATAVDLDDSGGLSVGDVIYGFVRMDTMDRDVPTFGNGLPTGAPGSVVNPPEEIGIIFSAQIKSLVSGAAGGIGTVYSLGATTAAGASLPYTLGSQMSASMAALVNPLLSDPTNTIFIGLSSATSTPIGGFTSIADFTTALGFGFELAGGILPGSADFFHFRAGLDMLSGDERSGVTIFDDAFGAGVTFDNTYVNKNFNNLGVPVVTAHDAVLFDSSVTAQAATAVGGHLAIEYTDNSNFALNVNRAVPEPAAVLIWIGTAIAFAIGSIRNRND
jgi:hypothetical protein